MYLNVHYFLYIYTYACIPHIKLPHLPAFPKNSAVVCCFTKCSSVTLLMAYNVALDNYINERINKIVFIRNYYLHKSNHQTNCGLLNIYMSFNAFHFFFFFYLYYYLGRSCHPKLT